MWLYSSIQHELTSPMPDVKLLHFKWMVKDRGQKISAQIWVALKLRFVICAFHRVKIPVLRQIYISFHCRDRFHCLSIYEEYYWCLHTLCWNEIRIWSIHWINWTIYIQKHDWSWFGKVRGISNVTTCLSKIRFLEVRNLPNPPKKSDVNCLVYANRCY